MKLIWKLERKKNEDDYIFFDANIYEIEWNNRNSNDGIKDFKDKSEVSFAVNIK